MPTFRFRVLFVDDEPAVRTTGAAILEAAGYEVLTAADGLEGLHALDEALPDLIISDLRMPNMSGFEFLAVVRNRFPQISTIALSGEYVTDNVPEGLLADTFFQKGDYSIPQLLAKVKELVRKAPERPVQASEIRPPSGLHSMVQARSLLHVQNASVLLTLSATRSRKACIGQPAPPAPMNSPSILITSACHNFLIVAALRQNPGKQLLNAGRRGDKEHG